MQILLLQENIEVREKVTFLLESNFGATVTGVGTVTEATACVTKRDRTFDLIIWESKTGVPPESDSFRVITIKIPTIVSVVGPIDEAAKTGNLVGIIDRKGFAEGIVALIQGLVQKRVLRSGDTDQEQVRIRTKLLLSVCPLKGDIYIRLSQNKYVKLFREGDVFDLADLEKYTVQKGVEYLYIRKGQCEEFAQKYVKEIQTLITGAKQPSLEEVAKMNVSVHETVQELTARLGFTKEVQELTKTQVQLTVKSMGKNPNLAELLKKLESGEGQYVASHSTLCAYLSCAMASKLQWGSESTFNKLSLASFLHDITLENQSLAEIETLAELDTKVGEYTEKEVKAYKDHPTVAADMVKRMSEIPPDVDTIIRQHHERPDGSGFPRKLGHSYIAPLSAVFIVAHDLSKFILKAGPQFEISNFIKEASPKYKSSQFKKVMASLETLTNISIPGGKK